MSKARIVLLAIAIVGVAGAASAQLSEQAELEAAVAANGLSHRSAANPFSLLDLSRIKWSHSYSVSYFSGGGYSGSAGLFQTSMLYEFSPKLSLALNLGVAHTGNLLSSENRQTAFLPGFTLDYHPSEKFRMILQVQTYDGMVNPDYYRSGLFHRPVGP